MIQESFCKKDKKEYVCKKGLNYKIAMLYNEQFFICLRQDSFTHSFSSSDYIVLI